MGPDDRFGSAARGRDGGGNDYRAAHHGFGSSTWHCSFRALDLIFFVVVAGRVPGYLGSSFSFVAVVIAASGYAGHGPNPNLDVALGGIIAAGVLYGIIALIVMQSGVGWVDRLMPPVVTGAVVAVIGLNLAPVAVKSVSGSQFDAGIGLLTVVIIGLIAVAGPGLCADCRSFSEPSADICSTYCSQTVLDWKAHRFYGVGRRAVDRVAEIHRSALPR